MPKSSVQSETAWRGREVAALVVVLASIAAFVTLLALISSPEIQRFDESVIRALRNQQDASNPIGPKWVQELARDYTALGGYGVLSTLTVLIALFLSFAGKRRRAWFAAFVVFAGYLVSTGLKAAIGRPRPAIVPYLSNFNSASFPSGHSMMSAVVYITFSLMLADLANRKRVSALLFIAPVAISAAVGFSRVYMGVHYPTDVFAGWCAGISWALGCWLIARRWRIVRDANSDSAEHATGT